MGLRRASDVRVEQRGAWFFRQRTIRSGGSTFRLSGGALARLEAEHASSAALVGESGGRRLWWAGDEYVWDDEDHTAEEVALDLWDRQRRRDHRFQRLRKLRAREEDADLGRRERIPDDVRIFVWTRDDGRCVRCGADDDLQFDHVIPVSRGGGNVANNVQILCGNCNRSKADSIV